ncbi:hypothetical protein BJX99DRAFT_258043 [Aspergillus californicus]
MDPVQQVEPEIADDSISEDVLDIIAHELAGMARAASFGGEDVPCGFESDSKPDASFSDHNWSDDKEALNDFVLEEDEDWVEPEFDHESENEETLEEDLAENLAVDDLNDLSNSSLKGPQLDYDEELKEKLAWFEDRVTKIVDFMLTDAIKASGVPHGTGFFKTLELQDLNSLKK